MEDQELRQAFEKINHRLDQMDQRIDRRFDQVDQRFDQIDQRFERIELRLDSLERRMDALQAETIGLAKLFGIMGESLADIHAVLGPIHHAIEELAQRLDRVVADSIRGRTNVMEQYQELEKRLSALELQVKSLRKDS